ncbi:MAG: SctK family type III secretion system sorting platform protein [Candidatus Spyradenecus sp.]
MSEDPLSLDRARALVADSTRWPLIQRFLWDFAALIDPTRQRAYFQSVLPPGVTIAPTALTGKKAERALLAHLGVEPTFYDFPAENGSRLLLLERAQYEQIAAWLGAIAYAEPLRAVLAGPDVRALKQSLPGLYPDVLRYTAYFAKWSERLTALRAAVSPPPKATDLPAALRLMGLRMLASLLADVPEALLLRQRLRFPEADAPGFEPLPREVLSPEHLDLLFFLLKLRFPEASDLCC